MRYSTQVKPISYIKANAAEVLEKLADSPDPMIITQHGEAKAVLMDIRAYEEAQETLALVRLVAHAREEKRQGRTRPFREFLLELRGDFEQKIAAE